MEVEGMGDEQEGMPSKITSECPPPPYYYKYFKTPTLGIDGESITPPLLSDVDISSIVNEVEGNGIENQKDVKKDDNEEDSLQRKALQKLIYGGTINHLRKYYTYNPEKDYKADLKAKLHNLLQGSLSLTSNVPPTQPPEIAMKGLDDTLQGIHDTLGEYRMHEGRENLISMREQEIHDLESLANKMEDLLTRTK